MHAFNWWCCLAATFAFLLAPARAQEPGEPPAPAEAMTAYRAVDNWVREWKVSPPAAAANNEPGANQPAPANLPACQAASITLRLAGEVIARGVEVATDDASRATVIARAAAAALKEAEPKLSIPRDAMYEATRREVAKSITISMQLAGALIPISPKDAADAMTMVNPGVEGVGARLGDRVEVMFPERMLVAGTEPGPALGTLVGKLADDVTLAVEPLSKLAKDHGVVYYRFRVSHLAQATASGSPTFLSRSGQVVRQSSIDFDELRRWGSTLAACLIQRQAMSKGVIPISFDPLQSGSNGPVDPVVQLICADALSRWLALSPRSEDESLRRAIQESYTSLLSDAQLRERVVRDPAASALLYVAFTSSAGRENYFGKDLSSSDIHAACWQTISKSFRRTEFLEELSPAARAMTCMALVLGPAPQDAQQASARDAIDLAYREAVPNRLVTFMPWLGYADFIQSIVEVREVGGTKTPARHSGPLVSAVALREMRSQLWAHQLRPEDLSPDQQDLAGGIMFTASKQPMPTWQMARPLAFIATMLGDPRLTEEKEVPEELSRLLLSLRFLRQLTAGDAEGFMYKNPDRAIGGVRSSLWDQRMPPEATAMTLLTVCETLRSLDEISKRQAAPDSK